MESKNSEKATVKRTASSGEVAWTSKWRSGISEKLTALPTLLTVILLINTCFQKPDLRRKNQTIFFAAHNQKMVPTYTYKCNNQFLPKGEEQSSLKSCRIFLTLRQTVKLWTLPKSQRPLFLLSYEHCTAVLKDFYWNSQKILDKEYC